MKTNKENAAKTVKRKPYTPKYGVIVLCDGEGEQEKIYNKLKKEGYQCKVVTA